jgi:sialic acid synthase SpsE
MNILDAKIRELAGRGVAGDIFIIGKGPSLDLVDCSRLPPGLVINLNDSERIHAGDVGIFSANWVRHSLQEEGFRCGFYLAGKPLPASVPHIVLPPVPINLDHEDLNIVRLQQDEFYDEFFLLLNALKLAQKIAAVRGSVPNVYLLGFDFTTSGGSLARKMVADLSGASAGEREVIIAAQEHGFRQFLHYFSAGDRLRLRHVGTKDYSGLTPSDFNREVCGVGLHQRQKTINLADPDRVLVVAEFTTNHLGDTARLVEMVERAREAGADLIKIQKRDVDTFYSPEQLSGYYWSPFGTTLGEYRRGLELDDQKLDVLDEACRTNEIEWFCSVLDMPSYNSIRRFNPRLIKVPSTISGHREYHDELARSYQGAIVASTGFTEQEYVDHVLNTFSKNEAIYLLHCISAYPTPSKDCNLAVVRSYHHLASAQEKILPGYSSHDLGSLGCMMAVAAGARMIEKHVKLGDVEWVHFDKVAVDLSSGAFAKFVREIRQAEEYAGSEKKRILDCEHHKYAKR